MEWKKTNPPPIPRIQELIAKYPCFRPESQRREMQDSWRHSKPTWRQRKSWGRFTDPRPSLPPKRILNQNLSEEGMIRKDFLAYLNKLSHNNQERICENILKQTQSKYLPMYIQTIWDIMLIQHDYQYLYIKLLEQMSNTMNCHQELLNECDTLWNQYVQDQGWLLTSHKNQEAYDDFCDYIKEKKRIMGALKAWNALLHANWVRNASIGDLMGYLLNSISQYAKQTPSDKEQLESLFNQILDQMEDVQKNDSFQKLLYNDWGQYKENWSPSVKFKWLDIKETYERNSNGLQRSHSA
jgi:hypothetical protein